MGFSVLICVVALVTTAAALDNGLARTPPMGWMSWERFECNLDCKNDPNNCISEKLYMTIADAMVANGFKDAGYEYVSIDDCWSAKERDPATNKIVADPDRFPHGIRALADYLWTSYGMHAKRGIWKHFQCHAECIEIHSKGLKLGIYGDMGSKTCAGYPGSQNTIQLDAQTFAEWEVDSLKVDGCYGDPKNFDSLFSQMGIALNQTGRPILYNCEWPLYQRGVGINPNYPLIANYCNSWRNYNDIDDSWDSLLSIIEFYGSNQGNFAQVAGPGAFNDPDEVIVGDPGLSTSQQQVQMAMWAIFAAPLFVSADLRNIDPVPRDILLNKGAIAINQDPLGIAGTRVLKNGNIELWVKKVLPQGSYAVAVLNLDHWGNKVPVTFSLSKLVPEARGTYIVNEIFTGTVVGTYTYNQTVTELVDESSVVFRKYTFLK